MAQIVKNDDLLITLQGMIQSGELTVEEAEAIWSFEGDDTSQAPVISPQPQMAPAQPQTVAPSDEEIASAIQGMYAGPQRSAADDLVASSTGAPFIGHDLETEDSDRLTNFVNFDGPQLDEEKVVAAQEELARRKEISEMSFIDYLTTQGNLVNPTGLLGPVGAVADLSQGRVAAAAAKGPGQIANAMTNVLPGLAALGWSNVTTNPEHQEATESFAIGKFDAAAEWNQRLNSMFGTSDALHPVESIAEASVSAITPGGFTAKGLAFGTDALTDQFVRQLITGKEDQYQTIFDRMGLSTRPELSPWLALPLGVAVGSVSLSAGARLTGAYKTGVYSTVRENPPVVEINQFDMSAPENLQTLTQTSDLYRAQWIDEIDALGGIIERAGVPNFNDVATKLAFDTHSALRSRVTEGLKLGKFSYEGRTFAPKFSPTVLQNAVQRLDVDTRQAVNNYINLRDVQDDLRINLRNARNAVTDPKSSVEDIQAAQITISEMTNQLARTGRDIRQYETDVPIVKEFHENYRSVTKSVRDFLDGDLFTSEFRQTLDSTRPNYVPLDFSTVDPSAPFWQRMSQAQQQNLGDVEKPWFLHNREVSGIYDVSRRTDPFDMLMEYTNSALNASVTNSVRLTLLDSLSKSRFGAGTVRKAEPGEAERFPDNVVKVFRDGVEEVWLTERLTADLMRFDPIVAKHPVLFSIKRATETTLTGPLSLTFAGTSAFRDAVTAASFRQQGVVVGGPQNVLSAIPEQITAKAKLEFSNNIKSKVASGQWDVLDVFKSTDEQLAFADKLADSYVDSTYHYIQSMGGYDGSIARNRINVGTNSLKELRRTLVENPTMQRAFGDSVAARQGVRGLVNIIDTFTTLYGSVMDAPRYAAISRTMREGNISDQDAVRFGAQISSDVRRTGRGYRSDEVPLTAQVTNPGIGFYIADVAGGKAAQLARESIPFVNPAIQGARLQFNRMIEDPVGTNMRLWLYTGMPTLLAYMWNESLGPEYNEYAMSGRASNDVVLNNYIGNPSLPPEQGIELPRGHETVLWGAPFAQALHMLSRGEGQEYVRQAYDIMLQDIVTNSTPLGYPAAMTALESYQGYRSPDHIFTGEGKYKVQPTGQEVLPHNMELLIRNMFGLVGNVAIESLHAVAADENDAPFTSMVEAAWNEVEKRTPILRNTSGAKVRNNSFSVPAKINSEKYDQMNEFYTLYQSFFNPDLMLDETGTVTAPGSRGYTGAREGNAGVQESGEIGNTGINIADDLPYVSPGPDIRPRPTNPLFPEVGALLNENLRRSGMGMSAIRSRDNTYRRFVRQLKDYNTGNASAIRAWQETLVQLGEENEEVQKLNEMLEVHDIDVSDYHDRNRLVNIIERERYELIRAQIDIFTQTEAQVTELLRQQGLLGPDESFSMEKHLKPYDAEPFKSK